MMLSRPAFLLALGFVACSLMKPSRDDITGGSDAGGFAGTLPDGSAATGGSGGTPSGGGGTTAGGTGGSSGGATGGSGGSSGATGGTAGTPSGGSGGAAGAPTLLFEDLFDIPKPEWLIAGDGAWTFGGGVATQTDINATHPTRWISTMGSLADYHVIAKARRLTSPNAGVLQIIARVKNADEFYYASFGPVSGEISFGIYTTTTDFELPGGKFVALPGGHDPNALFTLHLKVQGSNLHFWVDEVPGADSTSFDPSYATGAPGLKTYLMSGAYDSFQVWSQ